MSPSPGTCPGWVGGALRADAMDSSGGALGRGGPERAARSADGSYGQSVAAPRAGALRRHGPERAFGATG